MTKEFLVPPPCTCYSSDTNSQFWATDLFRLPKNSYSIGNIPMNSIDQIFILLIYFVHVCFNFSTLRSPRIYTRIPDVSVFLFTHSSSYRRIPSQDSRHIGRSAVRREKQTRANEMETEPSEEGGKGRGRIEGLRTSPTYCLGLVMNSSNGS